MKVDMSARAVTARLQLVSQLRRLCLELGKMKPVTSGKAAEANGLADSGLPTEPLNRPEASTS